MRSGIQEAEEFHSSGIIRAVPPLFEEEFLSIRRWLVAGFALVTFTPGATAQREPVLKQICKNIAADEFRHFKLFFTHMERYAAQNRAGAFSKWELFSSTLPLSIDSLETLLRDVRCTLE